MSNSTQEQGFGEGSVEKGLAAAKPHLLKVKVSRAGLEPAARWLKERGICFTRSHPLVHTASYGLPFLPPSPVFLSTLSWLLSKESCFVRLDTEH